MPQGTITQIEPSTGVVTIQPHDGTESAFFLHSETDEKVQPQDVVNFDVNKDGRVDSAAGLQATNVKVVKVQDDARM